MKNTTVNINTIKQRRHALSEKRTMEAKQGEIRRLKHIIKIAEIFSHGKKKECPHSYCDEDGDCIACRKNMFERTGGIIYNPRIHKQLTCDKVVSIVLKNGHLKELVGVYWKGTDGSEILFETTPEKAKKIIEIFNAKARA